MGESTVEVPQSNLQAETNRLANHLFDNVRIFSQIRGFKVEDAGTKIIGKAAGLEFTLIDKEAEKEKPKTKVIQVQYGKLRSAIEGVEWEDFYVSDNAFRHVKKLSRDKEPITVYSDTSNPSELQTSIDRLNIVTDDIVKSP